MEEEILNIEYHQKRLMICALNKAGNPTKAAPLLGINVRQVKLLMEKWNIKKTQKDNRSLFIIQNNHSTKKTIHNEKVQSIH